MNLFIVLLVLRSFSEVGGYKKTPPGCQIILSQGDKKSTVASATVMTPYYSLPEDPETTLTPEVTHELPEKELLVLTVWTLFHLHILLQEACVDYTA